MDKIALVETLIASEKNRSIVKIKVFNAKRPVIGAIQKVLNQIVILKTKKSEPVALTFADIESVTGFYRPGFRNIFPAFVKMLPKIFARPDLSPLETESPGA